MTTIQKLILTNNINGVRQLLATNPGAVNEQHNDRSPLYHAISLGNIMEEVVRVMVAAGANVNFQNSSGLSALHQAAWCNHKEIAEILVSAGANVNIQNKNRETPLFMAANRDAKEVARVLIAAGAIVDFQDQKGRTPLYMAALRGTLDMTNILLAAGARPNWASIAITGDMEGAKALLMTNPNDVNEKYEDGGSPLHKAAEYNSTDVAKLLLAAGANIDSQDQRGQSPLYRTTGNHAEKVAEILVAAGAYVNIQDKRGDSPLNYAITNARPSIAKIIVAAGGTNVNLQNQYGLSPLHIAAKCDDEKTSTLLLAAGANANIQDKNGRTPLMIAREKGRRKIVTILESPENYITAYREEQRRQKEKLRLDRISLLLQQQKYFPGDRVTVVNSSASATAESLSVGDVGEVLEYKIDDCEAAYVVRVVTGTQCNQMVSYSPTSLISYSEVMCQRLGLDDTLFQKYDRIIMTIRRQKYKELEIEKVAAIAARQMAKAKEISSHMKSIYIYDKTDAIPDSEVHTFLSLLLQDMEARYIQLAIEDKYEDAELCDSTKNELLQYYNEICKSSVSNHGKTPNDEKSELLIFLEDTCHIEDCMAKHYSAQLNTLYEIDSIKYLKLLLRIGSLRSTLSEFITSDEDISNIERATRNLFPDTINTNNDSNTNIPMIGKSRNESYPSDVLSSSNILSTRTFHADGTAIHNIRPLSETLDMGDSANRISYHDIYTGYFLQVIGVDVVIKVGDGRRDLAAEERILRYLRDRSKEAVGAIRLIDYSATSVPPYLVLEKYGEDIRSLFLSPAAARNCKKFIVYLLEAVDSIHKVGIMHGDLKPQNILFRNAVGNFGFKLCNFESACNIGEVRLVTKYTKAWVSPEVYFASENKREVKASAAIDVFSLGLILGSLFDGNCSVDKTILPVENPKDFHRALSDQEYLYTLLPCNDHSVDKPWIHSMCRLDSTQRATVNSIIRILETNSRTNLAMQDKYLKNNIDTNVDTIDDMILVSVSSCFESLKSHLTDLILSSVEISLNISNDDNNILEKLLIATYHYSGSLKGSSGSSDTMISEAKEGLKRMEDAIRVAMESHIATYEVDKRQEILELQTTILNRCQDLEAILNDRSADSKNIQATLNAFAQCSELLHQELLKVHQELDSMKQNLFQLAVTTRNIVNNNEKLRLSMDSLDAGINRIHKSKLEEYQTLIQSKERLQALIVSTPFIASSLQGAMTETNTRLLTLLKGIYDIPTLMVLLPELVTGTKHIKNTSIMFTDKYRLFFVCSHTLCIVPCGPTGQGYPLTVPKEWVKKAAPVFKVGFVALKLALTNSGLLFPYSDILKDLTIFEQQFDYFNAALRNLHNISISAVTAMECQTTALSKEDCLSFLDNCNAEGIRAAYEAIKEILKDFPNFTRNCGLVFVEHQGNVSWVLRGQEENWRLAMRER